MQVIWGWSCLLPLRVYSDYHNKVLVSPESFQPRGSAELAANQRIAEGEGEEYERLGRLPLFFCQKQNSQRTSHFKNGIVSL